MITSSEARTGKSGDVLIFAPRSRPALERQLHLPTPRLLGTSRCTILNPQIQMDRQSCQTSSAVWQRRLSTKDRTRSRSLQALLQCW